MTKFEATRIAQELVKAVHEGNITAQQARNRFKVVVAKYKQGDRFKQLQATNPSMWQAANILLSKKVNKD